MAYVKNLFDKNPNRDNKNELNFLNSNSPYLKAYNELLEKEKEEIENENKEMYQNEMLRGQEFSLSKAEQNNILTFVKNNKIYNEKTPLDLYFEINLMKRKINESDENSNKNENVHEESNDNKKYTTDDISFEIDIQGEITKKIRNSSKKQHPRGMVLHGPIAKWYRLNEDHENTKLKGYFDIRKIEFKNEAKENIKVEEEGGWEMAGYSFATQNGNDYLYVDLDRPPELRQDWFSQVLRNGLPFPSSKAEYVFFWIQEMEAWFLKQPQAVNNWICSEPITMSKQIDIGEDKSIKGKTPDEIEHLQRKPSDIMNTLFQRYLLSGNKDKNGKPKKLEYGKLRHAPRIIPFLDAETMLLQDKELAHFVGFVNHISPL